MPGEKYKRVGENPNEPSAESIVKTYETVYLLKWLFPNTQVKQYREKLNQVKRGNFPKFYRYFVEKEEGVEGEAMGSSRAS